jgi:hypothetical protein
LTQQLQVTGTALGYLADGVEFVATDDAADERSVSIFQRSPRLVKLKGRQVETALGAKGAQRRDAVNVCMEAQQDVAAWYIAREPPVGLAVDVKNQGPRTRNIVSADPGAFEHPVDKTAVLA